MKTLATFTIEDPPFDYEWKVVSYGPDDEPYSPVGIFAEKHALDVVLCVERQGFSLADSAMAYAMTRAGWQSVLA